MIKSGKAFKKIESYIENSDILIFQDYNKGVIDKKLLKLLHI